MQAQTLPQPQSMTAITRGTLRYYQVPGWAELRHGIFTRHGGTSRAPWTSLNVGGTVGDAREAVRANHQLMYDALDVNAARVCSTWQVHGVDVVLADGPVQGRQWLAKADGIITNRPATPLVQRYADCVPLLFYDPETPAIGLAHAGWRGTVHGMAANMVQAMRQAFGTRPAALQVVIGPSISAQAYQVGDEVVDATRAYYGEVPGMIRRDPADGSAYLDLWLANVTDLQRSGVGDVIVSGICTFFNTGEFFSHRAENGRTGRFGVVMSL